MRNLTLNLLCTLVIPAAVAVAQPCTSAPGPIASFSFIEPTACIPRLVWSAAPGADKYIIYRSLTFNINDAVVVNTTRELRYDDFAFPATLYGRDHYYFVRGVNACGQGPARLRGGNVLADLRISGGFSRAECNRIILDWIGWNASPGVTISYSVWRAPTPDGARVLIAEGLPSSFFIDTSPPRGWSTYWVSARSPVCEGPEFRLPAVFLEDPLLTPVLTVTGAPGCGTVALSFSQGLCADSYSIFRAPANHPDQIVQLGVAPLSPYFDHVPDRSIEYSYAVIAHTRFGDTPPSLWQRTSVSSDPPELWGVDSWPNRVDCTSGSAILEAPLRFSSDVVTFQWYKNGQPLTDGDHIWGAQSLRLTISPVLEPDNGYYTVSVTNDCGTRLSEPFNVIATEPCPCPPCLPDFNQDGGVDGGDVAAFIFAWEASNFCADANYDGGIDGQDLSDWLICWESCSC